MEEQLQSISSPKQDRMISLIAWLIIASLLFYLTVVTFEGFLPIKKGRKKRLEELSREIRTMVFYESPHKILKTLNDLKIYLGDQRKVSVSKELTKIHESTIRGNLGTINLGDGKIRGEFVIIVEGLK